MKDAYIVLRWDDGVLAITGWGLLWCAAALGWAFRDRKKKS